MRSLISNELQVVGGGFKAGGGNGGMSTQRAAAGTGGTSGSSGGSSHHWWDDVIHWVQDVFGGGGGSGGSSTLSYEDANRACSDIGVTSWVIEHGGGGEYNGDGAETAAELCHRAIGIIENQKAAMDQAIDRQSKGEDPNGT